MTDSTSIISFEQIMKDGETLRQIKINGEVIASLTIIAPTEARTGNVLSSENLSIYRGSLQQEVDIQDYLHQLTGLDKSYLPPLKVLYADIESIPEIGSYTFSGSVSLNDKIGEVDWSIAADSVEANVVMGDDVMTLVDVASLFGLGDDLKNALPPDGLADHLLDNLGLKQFSLKLSNNKLTDLAISISTQKPLQLLDDKITITPTLNFACQRDEALDKLVPMLEINGQWTLNGSELYVSASSSGDLVASLGAGQSLDISGLLALIPELDEEVKKDLEEAALEFSVLDMRANYKEKSFYLNLQAQSEWEFDIGITSLQLAEAGFLIDYKGTGDDKGVQQFAVNGLLVIGGVELALGMEYNRADKAFEFNGSITQTINIGELIEDLAEKFSGSAQDFPDVLKKFELNSFILSCTRTKLDQPTTQNGKTVTSMTTGSVSCDFTIGSTQLGLRIPIDTGSAKEYKLYIGGEQGLELNLSTISTDQLEGFVAYLASSSDDLALRDILPDFDWLPDIKIQPSKILYGSVQDGSSNSSSSSADKSSKLMALEISTPSLQLSQLPSMGGIIPADTVVGLESFMFAYATDKLTPAMLAALNAADIQSLQQDPISEKGLNKGMTLVVNALLGQSFPLMIDMGGTTSNQSSSKQSSGISNNIATNTLSATTVATAATSSAGGPEKTGSTQSVSKKVGPVTVESIALGFGEGHLRVSVDGSIAVSGIEVGLMGLSLSIPIEDLMEARLSGIKLGLNGLSLSYEKGKMVVSGGLLREPILDAQGKETGGTEYLGQVMIRVNNLAITGMGSYAKYADGNTSAFVYATLLTPLGAIGPFMLEGIALGMGYNRGINAPPVGEVNKFPLVTALSGEEPVSMADLKEMLSKYLPAQQGQYMLAAGVKVTTFKMVDSIVVLMMEFGQRFSLYIVGISSMQLPPIKGVPALGGIEMAFKLSIEPSKGFFGLEAVLTDNSFLLSEDGKLTGGFAFYSWSSGPHAGDFVVSLGGYHPDYNKPAHYPVLDRLGFTLQMGSALQFKGAMYAALTSSAIMAGASLDISSDVGIVSAKFSVSMDFIISWSPFFYDVRFAISVSVSVNLWIPLSGEISASLHIWGPEFAGKASLECLGYTVTFDFGAQQSAVQPVSWQEFRDTYLPKQDVLKVTLIEGQLAEREDSAGSTFFTVDPDTFELRIDSKLPVNKIEVKESELPLLAGLDSSSSYEDVETAAAALEDVSGSGFAIAPMGGKLGAEVTDWCIVIDVKGPAGMRFTAQSVESAMPLALWGDSIKPDIKSDERNKKLLSGLVMTSAATKPPGFTEPVDADEFKFQDVVENDPYWQWGQALALTADTASSHEQILKDTLQAPAVQSRRESILNYFGHQGEQLSLPNLVDKTSSAFIGMPQVMEAT